MHLEICDVGPDTNCDKMTLLNDRNDFMNELRLSDERIFAMLIILRYQFDLVYF